MCEIRETNIRLSTLGNDNNSIKRAAINRGYKSNDRNY